MSDDHVPDEMRFILYREAIMTATLLDGLIGWTLDGKTATRYHHFWQRSSMGQPPEDWVIQEK